jgi:CheY-like chemotaxis protein
MPTILLVEDDKQNYEMMMRRLRRRDYAVELATDGEAAVEKARSVDPDLILMDIKLPEMDGYEATRAIRRFPEGRGADIPVIALTAHAFKEEESKAHAVGCDGYHAKPVSLIQLVEQMEDLMDQRSDEVQAGEPQ